MRFAGLLLLLAVFVVVLVSISLLVLPCLSCPWNTFDYSLSPDLNQDMLLYYLVLPSLIGC